MPEMVGQLVEEPKVRYQDEIQRRTAEQIVALSALVLPERISERSSEQSEVIKVTEKNRPRPELAAYSGADSGGLCRGRQNCPSRACLGEEV